MYARPLNTRIQRPRNYIFYRQGHENGTESVRKACTERSVRTGLYARICTYRSVNAGLYVRVRTYQTAHTSSSLFVHVQAAMAEQVAIHKTRNWTLFIDIANKTAPVCTRTRRCTFPGYINENTIQNNFQRVPPLLDGSVCKFPDIAVEMRFVLTTTCKNV